MEIYANEYIMMSNDLVIILFKSYLPNVALSSLYVEMVVFGVSRIEIHIIIISILIKNMIEFLSYDTVIVCVRGKM